jgi:two-component sensor histidine kinase/ABC-type multidrug transport system ATPase subunit
MEKRLVLSNIFASNKTGHSVFRGLSITLQPRLFYMVLGDSGSGKSMLVEILAGLRPYNSGKIYFNNQEFIPKYPGDSIRAGISFLFQRRSEMFQTSVAENIFLGNYGVKGFIRWKSINVRAKNLLKEVGLDINPAMNIKSVSKDDQILILLARAYATQPSILVIDDALTDLNRVHAGKFIRSLMNYRSKGGSILYLSSHPEQLVYLADIIGILEDENIKCELTASEVKSDPELLMNLYIRKGHPGGNIHGHLSDMNDRVIKAFFKSSELLASEYELQDVLEFLGERACQLTEAYACIIKLVDNESGENINSMKYVSDNSEEELPSMKPHLEQEILGNGKLLFFTGRELSESLNCQQNSVQAIACAPIKIRDRIAGMIQLFFTEKPEIISDLEVIKTFANQTALAIENTRLLGRSALLQEAHHRIKNNLQSIISLLTLQAERGGSEEVIKAVTQSINRIKAIAGVHEILSRDQRSGSYINVRQIVQKLVDWVIFKTNDRKIEVVFSGQDLFLPYKKATSLALVINELLTNCLEHAFPDRREGRILINMVRDGQRMRFDIKDNGLGLQGIKISCIKENEHLGLWLVKLLVTKDLLGQFRLEENRGITATVIIPI